MRARKGWSTVTERPAIPRNQGGLGGHRLQPGLGAQNSPPLQRARSPGLGDRRHRDPGARQRALLDEAGQQQLRANLDLPEGVHLEFLPKGSAGLMPTERLWPLTKKALADGLFEEIEEVEEALVRRCVELLDQPEAIRELANYLGGPRRKRSSRRHEVPSIIYPDSV